MCFTLNFSDAQVFVDHVRHMHYTAVNRYAGTLAGNAISMDGVGLQSNRKALKSGLQ